MRNNSSIKIGLTIGIAILFIFSAVFPIVFGYKADTTNEELKDEYYVFNRFDKHCFPETYNSDEKDYLDLLPHSFSPDTFSKPEATTKSSMIETKDDGKTQISSSDGPMDSPWPMYGHNSQHTGRSPYSTINNPYDEKWRFKAGNTVQGSVVIDNEGIIYFGCYDGDFYAVYPNGILKWMCDLQGHVESSPAIDENGTIYVGTAYNSASGDRLYAFYPNGTIKWTYFTGEWIFSSPTIGNDGTVYFSTGQGYPWYGHVYALYPNGTLKWSFHTNHVIYSSPAIGLDGTIYCGSHDDYVYALYPNNGTVKWKFNTGSWVHGSPTVGSDGTVYIGSDNNLLYAFYPNNGTVKWTHSIGAIWGSPAIGDDGTLYVGTWQQKFHAISPGGIPIWSYDAPGRIWFGASAAISADGIIYFGTTWMDGGVGAFIVLNPDGSERMDYRVIDFVFESSPAIGNDGTIYVASSFHGAENFGTLHAFGEQDPNAPSEPDINGPNSGNSGTEYDYIFQSTSPLGNDIYYYIDWGDGAVEEWIGPYSSGEEVIKSHSWSSQGTYTIKARGRDTDNLLGPWGSLEVSMPRNKATSNVLFWRFLERFPLLERLLSCFNLFD